MWKINFRSPLEIAGVIVGFSGVLSLYAEQAFSEETPVQSEYELLILTAGCVSWALGTLDMVQSLELVDTTPLIPGLKIK